MDNEKNNQNYNSLVESLKTVLKTYDEVIAHYNFVISDLSGEVYVPALQTNKKAVVSYLTSMRSEWKKCRAHVQMQLDALQM